MLKLISIDAPPGTLRELIPDLSRQNAILLPTSTSETASSKIHETLVACITNIIHRISHISRCRDADKPIVCVHWHDMPMQVRKNEHFVLNFIKRHIRSVLVAHGLENEIEHCAIVLDIDTSYAFEILMEEMSASSISSSDIDCYMRRVKILAGPGATIIPINNRAFDTPYLRGEIANRIAKGKQNGFPDDPT